MIHIAYALVAHTHLPAAVVYQQYHGFVTVTFNSNRFVNM